MRSLEWLHENFYSNNRPHPNNVAYCRGCDWSLRIVGHDVFDALPQLEEHIEYGPHRAEPNVWDVLTISEQEEYATLTLDYWYLQEYSSERRARLNELLLLVQERTENEQRKRRDRKDPKGT